REYVQASRQARASRCILCLPAHGRGTSLPELLPAERQQLIPDLVGEPLELFNAPGALPAYRSESTTRTFSSIRSRTAGNCLGELSLPAGAAVIAAIVWEAVVALRRPERSEMIAADATPRRDAVVMWQVIVRPVAVPVHRSEEGVRPVPVRYVI